MKALKHLTALCAAATLGACSATTPPAFVPVVSGTASANADGTYTIVENGTVTALPAPRTSAVTGALGLDYWSTANEQGYTHTTADVTAVAVMKMGTNVPHAGISGTAAASVPTSGVATYTGAFSGTYLRRGLPSNTRGAMTTSVNFGTGLLLGNGADGFGANLSVAAVLSGTNFNGTATYSAVDYFGAATADLTGGFYGSNTLTGIFQNDTLAGLIWGDTP